MVHRSFRRRLDSERCSRLPSTFAADAESPCATGRRRLRAFAATAHWSERDFSAARPSVKDDQSDERRLPLPTASTAVYRDACGDAHGAGLQTVVDDRHGGREVFCEVLDVRRTWTWSPSAPGSPDG